jgi:predicted phosphodiesterase
MRITFVGDIHASWGVLRYIMENHCPHNRVLQVGDFGLFGRKDEIQPQSLHPNLFFIHGNHDNPDVCEKYRPNYLGRFGQAFDDRIFFVSGAWSIDQHCRIPGLSWFHNEELSTAEAQAAFELYVKVKPRYMVTHDGPTSIIRSLVNPAWGGVRATTTTRLFDAMWAEHKPELWIFGHHHNPIDRVILGTRFVCLDINRILTLDLSLT